MKRKTILGVLLLACAAGIGFNLFTVVTRERALANDAIWRFRIAGFDPLDPFRGRFIEFTTPDLLALEAYAEENGDVDTYDGAAAESDDGAVVEASDGENAPFEVEAADDGNAAVEVDEGSGLEDGSAVDAEIEARDGDEDGADAYPSWLKAGDWFYAALERDGEGYARIARVSAEEPSGDGAWLKLRYRGNGAIEALFTRYYVNEEKADSLDRRFAANRDSAYITVRVSRGVGVITGVGFGD
jgi:hypothetical protein